MLGYVHLSITGAHCAQVLGELDHYREILGPLPMQLTFRFSPLGIFR